VFSLQPTAAFQLERLAESLGFNISVVAALGAVQLNKPHYCLAGGILLLAVQWILVCAGMTWAEGERYLIGATMGESAWDGLSGTGGA